MRIKMGVTVLAALALSATMAPSASAASAFLASKNEKLLAEKVATQVFTVKAGKVECGKINILSGTTSTAEISEQLALIDYENCKAFGFVEVQITPAHYVFYADGSVVVEKLIKILVPADQCEISIPAQTTNNVDYTTKGNNILIEPLVNNILYDQNANCGGGAGHFKDGTYRGHLEVMIPSGTVSFMSKTGQIQNVSLTPVESGTGKMASGKKDCPENAAKTEVVFKAIFEWCEYEIKNETLTEAVIIRSLILAQPEGECEFGGGKLCVTFQAPTGKVCEEGITVLAAKGGNCFDRLEYETKPPSGKAKATFHVTTMGQTSGILAPTPIRNLTVE